MGPHGDKIVHALHSCDLCCSNKPIYDAGRGRVGLSLIHTVTVAVMNIELFAIQRSALVRPSTQ